MKKLARLGHLLGLDRACGPCAEGAIRAAEQQHQRLDTGLCSLPRMLPVFSMSQTGCRRS